MKTHTSNFKNEIKKFGREIDSKITYTLNNESIELGSENLNSVTPHYEGSLLKSVMKQLDIDSNNLIPIGTIINYQFGVKIGVDENEQPIYEYINFGNYIVKEVETQEDTESYLIKCYDKMLYSMVDYVNLNITYPITIRNYINAICTYLGLTFKNANSTFANYDKEIPYEMFLDENGNPLEYTFRDVLDQLAEVTASTICINEDDDQLEIRYINTTNDTIDGEYLKNINVKFNQKYGPINSIVLSRSAESDNVYLQDTESVAENGLCELKIVDNQIMNFDDRSEYLTDILSTLDGVEFYINDFASTGIGYYNLCDKYNVEIENNSYPCIMLNDEFLVTQGLEENIHTDLLETSETDYTKADKTDRKINKTTLIVDKQKQEIVATVDNLRNDIDTNYMTISETEQLVIDAQNGLNNTITKTGGNNLIRNSSLLFKDTDNNYEYWTGTLERGSAGTYDVISETGSVILTKTTEASQSIMVTPDTYTLSFKYKRLSSASTITFAVNNESITFEEPSEGEIQKVINSTTDNITISFLSSIDNGYCIYDLMLNKGDQALNYSQNINETISDTVKIGKGISVVSSSTDTITRVDSDGFRVLNKNNETDVLLKATDTGTYTKTLKCSGYAEISGLRIQETDSQTWITGII